MSFSSHRPFGLLVAQWSSRAAREGPMSCDPDTRMHFLNALAAEAERLQTQVNEFIGRATMVRIDLPAALYDANAQLLLVPGMLRELAVRRAETHRVIQAPQARTR
jgi:hypothetical protein